MKEKSQFVCARCGVAVHLFSKYSKPPGEDSVWKHYNNGYGPKTCGQKPIVTERRKHEQRAI